MLKITGLEETILTAKKLANKKFAEGKNADEFVEKGDADGFEIYVTAGKTVDDSDVEGLHENPRDVFMLVLEGEIKFTFEKGKQQVVRAGEYFVLPKRTKHRCVFKEMTIAIEGVCGRGL